MTDKQSSPKDKQPLPKPPLVRSAPATKKNPSHPSKPDSKSQPPSPRPSRPDKAARPSKPETKGEPPAKKRPAPPPSDEKETNGKSVVKPSSMAPFAPIIKGLLSLLVLVALVGGSLVYLTWSRQSASFQLPQLDDRPYFFWDGPDEHPDPDELAVTLRAYLSAPELLPANILEQLNDSQAVPVLYNVEEQRFHFVFPRDQFKGDDDFLKLTDRPESVQRGSRQENNSLLDKLQNASPDSIFFSFPAGDLIIHPERMITVPYEQGDYMLTLNDLVCVHFNRSIYGGFYVNRCRSRPESASGKVINAGAFVAYPGEPSLKEFVRQITNYDDPPEKRAQALLDFVTGQIKLDKYLLKPAEAVKKPQEILMSGTAGLVERAVLLASLLEQTEINYFIIYTDESIALIIEGEFPAQAGALVMIVNDRAYHLADTTGHSFTIGHAAPTAFRLPGIRFIQRPGINSRVLDLQTGQPVD